MVAADPSRTDDRSSIDDHSRRSEESRSGVRIPGAIFAVAALLASLDLATTLAVGGVDRLLEPTTLGGHVLTLALTGTIALGTILLARSDVAPARYPRVGAWFAGGLLVDLGINLVLIALYGSTVSLAAEFQWAVFAAALGGLAGLVVGGVEARAIDRAVASERAAVRAQAVAAQRDWLDYLNSLLRHEVLNNANVIGGYARLIEEAEADTDVTPWAATIQRHANDMTDVIQDVRVLLDVTHGEPTIRRIDLVDVVDRELEHVRGTFPGVETDLDVEEEVVVAADEILGRVFANLFQNAVEHNDADAPRVEVAVTRASDTALVRVADNGPGIPESSRDSLFERGEGDHGLGLYLVGVLLDRYGGDVDLTETGSAGTVFTVELPLADSEESDATAAAAEADAFPLEGTATPPATAGGPERSD